MSTENHQYSSGAVSFTDAWERITSATDIKTLTELGELLGKRQQTISASKQKNLFPYGWAFPVAERYNLLTEWILTGKGPKRLADVRGPSNYGFAILDELNQWLSEVVVNEPGRREWFRVSLEDAFPMFREWKKRKQAEQGTNTDTPENNVV